MATNRTCGQCSVCCNVFPIAAQGLLKVPFEPCRHLTEQGCSIYATRPQVCREFTCLYLDNDPERTERPDKCGLVDWQTAQGIEEETFAVVTMCDGSVEYRQCSSPTLCDERAYKKDMG